MKSVSILYINYFINNFNVRICFNPDRETLFVSGLDDTLLGSDELLSPFSKVELNRISRAIEEVGNYFDIFDSLVKKMRNKPKFKELQGVVKELNNLEYAMASYLNFNFFLLFYFFYHNIFYYFDRI